MKIHLCVIGLRTIFVQNGFIEMLIFPRLKLYEKATDVYAFKKEDTSKSNEMTHAAL